MKLKIRETFLYEDVNYILDTIDKGNNEFVNIIVVQGYDKANKMENISIPDLIINNIDEEIPDQNVYFLSENLSRQKKEKELQRNIKKE